MLQAPDARRFGLPRPLVPSSPRSTARWRTLLRGRPLPGRVVAFTSARMTTLTRPPHRRKLGLVLAGVGTGVWLLGGVRFLGSATTTSAGTFLAAVGVSFLLPPPARGWLRRRTSLVVIVPALLLFSLVLLAAAVVFAESFEPATSASRWIGSTLFLLFSSVMVSVLYREVVLRFDVLIAQRRHDLPSRWRFTPRWKDDLLCASPDGQLVLVMAMRHVHFPPEEAWARQVPEWAKDRRTEILSALEEWCVAYGVLLTVDERAFVGSV